MTESPTVKTAQSKPKVRNHGFQSSPAPRHSGRQYPSPDLTTRQFFLSSSHFIPVS